MYTVRKERWIKHYTEFWNGAIDSNDEATTVLPTYDGTDVHEEDMISVNELHAALKEEGDETRVFCRQDFAEVLKHGGRTLELHFLTLIN